MSTAARSVFVLEPEVRAKTVLLFAWIAKRFDWPCCLIADGRILYRHYSTIAIHNIRGFATEVLWPGVYCAPGENLKGVL